MKISLIIPTLNAEQQIDYLLQTLNKQTVPPDEIIVIDSDSDDATEVICHKYQKVTFIKVKRHQFDHGKTRDYALRQSSGNIVLFLTQDAIPANNRYIEKILSPFQDERVAMVGGRQIARKDANKTEKLIRKFNYTAFSNVRSQTDIPTLGIKTFFLSNVCSAYRKSAYLQIGGFDYPILTNEDMLIASRFIYGGYKIAYYADAKVIHSHNNSLKQEFSRNFDIGVFMNMYSHFFRNTNTLKEGLQMVKYILMKLIRDKHFLLASYFCLKCTAKLSGYQLGINYKKLNRYLILSFTNNKNFWHF